MLFLLPTTESVTFSIAFTASGGAADIDGLSTALLILIMNTVLNLTVNTDTGLGLQYPVVSVALFSIFVKEPQHVSLHLHAFAPLTGDFRPAAAAVAVACAR